MTSFAFVVRDWGSCPYPPTSAERASPHPLIFLTKEEGSIMAKDEFIRFRVAGWEKFHISKSAEKAHISVSEFVRSSAMGREVTVIEGVDELLTELRRQGSNLNQLTIMA